jgi:hypothetical protein
MSSISRYIRHFFPRPVLIVCALLSGSAAGVWGTTYFQWAGSGSDTNWTTIANWNSSADGTTYSAASSYPSSGSTDIVYFTGTAAATVVIDTAVTVQNLNFNTAGSSTISLSFTTNDLTVSGGAQFGNNAGSYGANVILTGNGVSSDEAGGSGQLILQGGFDDNETKTNTISFKNYASLAITGGSFWINHSAGQLQLLSSDATGLVHIGSSVTTQNASNSVTVTGVTVLVDGYSVATTVSGTTMTVTVSDTTSSAGTYTVPMLYYTDTRTGSSTGSFTLTGGLVSGSPLSVSANTTVPAALTSSAVSGAGSASLSFTITPGGTAPSSGDILKLNIYLNDGFSLIGTVSYTYTASGYIVWDGSSGTGWDTAANWSGNAVPDSSSLVYIPNVTPLPVISSGIAAVVQSVTIQNGGSLTIASGGTLTGTTMEIATGGSCSAAGTATFSAVTIATGGSYTLTGILNAVTITVNGSGTLLASGGTVQFTGTSSWTCAQPVNSPVGTFSIVSGTLTPASDIFVSGTWTNSGTFVPGTHKVTFTGSTGSITAGGTSFYNLVVNSAGTVTASTPVAAGGTLTVTSGTLAIPGTTDALSVTGIISCSGTISLIASATITASSGGTLAAVTQSGSSAVATISAGGATTVTSCTNDVGLTVSGSGTVTLGSGTLSSGSLTIGSGSAASLSGNLSVSGSVSNGGTLNAGSYTISVGGSWANTGTFNQGTGSVVFTGTAAAAVTGTNTFYNFTYDGSAAGASKTISFAAGVTQTVAGKFLITGSSSYRVVLTSNAPATRWTLSVPASSAHVAVSYATVSYATSVNDISAYTDYSGEGTVNTTTNWFITTYYWKGGTAGTPTAWATAANWYKDSGFSSVCTTPPDPLNISLTMYAAGSSYSLIVPSAVSVSAFIINSGCRVVLGGYTMTAATITNNGTLAVDGTVAAPLSGTTITQAAGSSVEYYSATGTITNTTTYAGLGLTAATGYVNLIIAVPSGYVYKDSTNSALIVQGTTTVAASCSVETTGSQTYGGAVALSSDTTFTANAAGSARLVQFSNTVTGAGSLTIGSATKVTNVEFDGTVSSVTNLTVSGTTNITASLVSTTGNQTYSGAVTLTGDTTLTANSGSSAQLVTFGSTVTGTGSLIIGSTTVVTNLSCTGVVGLSTTLDVSGTAALNTPSVTTAGLQQYRGAVTLGCDTLLNAGSTSATGVLFSATLDGAFDLTFGTTTAATFAGAAGSITPLHTVTTTAATDIGSSFIQTSASTFLITAGTVSAGTAALTFGQLQIASGAAFVQTGANTAAVIQQAASILLDGAASVMNWDSGEAGGYLTVGSISNTASGTLNFHKKNITFASSATIGNLVFYDMVIPSGVTITLDGNIRVRRDVEIASGASYVPGTYVLTLGNTGSAVATEDSADGYIYDMNSTPVSLGTVSVYQGTTTKTFGAHTGNHQGVAATGALCSVSVLNLTDTTSGAGTVTLNNVTAGTILNTGSPSFSIGINTLAAASRTTASTPYTTTATSATFSTTGSLTAGTLSADTFSVSGGLSVPAASGTFTVAGTVGSAAGAIKVDCPLVIAAGTSGLFDTSAGSSAVSFGGTVNGASTTATLTVTAGSGTVTFEASAGAGTAPGSVSVTAGGGIAVNGGSITTVGTQEYYGPLTLGASAVFTAADAPVLFSDTVDSDFSATPRSLTVSAGTGDVSFTGAAGSTASLGTIVITCGACTFDAVVSSSGTMTVTNSGLLLSAENADISLTSGTSFVQNGTGGVQLAGGIMTSGTGALSFSSDVYLCGSDTDGMTLGGGSGSILIGASGSKNLHIAASTAAKTITIASALTASNIILYGGTVSLAADITADNDLVLLSGSAGSMYADSATGLPALYAYNTAAAPSRSGTAAPSFASFPSVYPDGTAFIDGSTISYCGAFDGSSLNGHTVTAGQNFYDNGVDLSATGVWYLVLKNNSTASDAFAEAYNCTVAYSNANYWVAAAENVTDGGTNACWDFSRPALSATGTYTVYDDVIRVECVDTADGITSKLIENSNNEISAAAAAITYYTGSSLAAFSGTYTDPDCTISTDGAGDLSVFYIKAGLSWNTDATGISSGQNEITSGSIHYDDSTDRSGTHMSSIPYLNLPKALSTVYATLRDSHKNRIAHYYSAAPVVASVNSAAGATFTAVADHASPVLVTVHTGQELHTTGSGTYTSQTASDAHNFIELRYSEPVSIGDLLYSGGAENQQVQTSFNSAAVHGGALTNNSSGFTLAGLAIFSAGSVIAGDRTTGLESPVVHALYRTFSLTAGGTAAIQPARVRVSIAGYADGTVSTDAGTYRNWDGYIDSAVTPSGSVQSAANSYITDVSGNSIDDYASYAATTNHNRGAVAIDSATDGVYGVWDTGAPVFAPYIDGVTSGYLWTTGDSSSRTYEIVGTVKSSSSAYLQRVEFHLFDNTPAYTSAATDQWLSKNGWIEGSATVQSAPDTSGGSRPFTSASNVDTTNKTPGGIRRSSLTGAASAFTYTYSIDGTSYSSRSFSSDEIVQTVKSSLYRTESDSSTATSDDGLYIGLPLNSADTALPIRTTFIITFTPAASYITDLAGNRITQADSGSTVKVLHSIDVTPPQFTMTLAPVGASKLYVVFSKQLAYEETLLSSSTDATIMQKIVDQFELVTSVGDSIDVNDTTSDFIDHSSPAEFIGSSKDYTALLLPLAQTVTLNDVEHLWLRVIKGSSAENSLSGALTYPTLITDSFGNYMTYHTCHALSDFALNAVNVLYAQTDDTDTGYSEQGVYGTGTATASSDYAVHDFSADAGNYGKIRTGHDIVLQVQFVGGTDSSGVSFKPVNSETMTLIPALKASLTASWISDKINAQTGSSWRVWLPTALDSMASGYNTDTLTSPSAAVSAGDSAGLLWNFTLPDGTDSSGSYNWAAGDQVQFLFRIDDSSGSPIMINHDGDSTTDAVPLYALWVPSARLQSGDYSFADLWSFTLTDITRQRGGVTILNNVINVALREQTVIEVTMPSAGDLNVYVMTLDGNIVRRLSHGTVSKGVHYYRWNGTNNAGNSVARGLYFVRVVAADIDETRKVLCVKE